MDDNQIKKYIADRYRDVMRDVKIAKDDDHRFRCLTELSKLTNMAAEMYGFDFSDSLGGEVGCEQ